MYTFYLDSLIVNILPSHVYLFTNSNKVSDIMKYLVQP